MIFRAETCRRNFVYIRKQKYHTQYETQHYFWAAKRCVSEKKQEKPVEVARAYCSTAAAVAINVPDGVG